jgi:O-antigen/teichoic acid export membrane protein
LSTISRNIFGLFLSDFIPSILSYVFLILITNTTGTNVIGIIGFIISISGILSALSNVEIHIGMKRFLGKSIANNDWNNFKQISSASTLFVLITSICILIIFLNPFLNFLDIFGFDKSFIPIIVVIVIGSNLQNLFKGILTSALRSNSLIIPQILASLFRFPLLFLFLHLSNLTELNVTWSYTIFFVVSSVFLFLIVIYFLKQQEGKSFYNIISNIKLVLRGSISRWIPNVIFSIGSKLNILIIFSLSGAVESGLFYISWAIFGVLVMLINSITQIAHPFFSGIVSSNEQQILLKKFLKLGFLCTIPLSSLVLFYSKYILMIFGSDFSISSEILVILIIGIPFMIFNEIVYYFYFARGNYHYIFYLGLIANVPRIFSYFLLIPEFGNNGAAWAFTIGSFLQIIPSVIILQKSKIKLPYHHYFLLIIIPFLITYLVSYIDIGILGVIPAFIISYIIFLKIKLFSEDDMKYFLQIFSSNEKAIKRNDKIIKILKSCKLI